MAITIYDVAREANVSMATVSRVVNGNQNVKPATRKKVLDCIERLGYRPNAVARGLASKKTTTVGVIVPDISKNFYAELSRGIADVATMYEYNIILSNSDEGTDREVQLLEDHLGKQVDGIIFMSDSITDEVRAEMATANVPIVLTGTLDMEKKFPTVNIDFEQAAYDAVQRLIQNGHKKVTFVSGPFTRDLNRIAKLEGYRRALQDAGLSYDERYVFELENHYDAAYEAWNEIKQQAGDSKAFIATNDTIGVGLLNSLIDDGMSVPEEYEILCFEHSILARVVRPQMTTVVVPLYDLGAVSMRLLTKLMNEEEVEEEHVILPYRIEERKSVN